jgi:hypothetical protein
MRLRRGTSKREARGAASLAADCNQSCITGRPLLHLQQICSGIRARSALNPDLD